MNVSWPKPPSLLLLFPLLAPDPAAPRAANLRIAIFFSSATLAGAFGGILAWAISHMGGIGGKGGWAWIFIVRLALAPLTFPPLLAPGHR